MIPARYVLAFFSAHHLAASLERQIPNSSKTFGEILGGHASPGVRYRLLSTAFFCSQIFGCVWLTICAFLLAIGSKCRPKDHRHCACREEEIGGRVETWQRGAGMDRMTNAGVHIPSHLLLAKRWAERMPSERLEKTSFSVFFVEIRSLVEQSVCGRSGVYYLVV